MKGSGLKLVLRGAVLVVALTCLTLAPALAQGAQAPIAQMSVSDVAIAWSSAAAHDLLVLRVSGPEGLIITREFAGGESPSLSIFTEAGTALPDGSYTWELWVERQMSQGEQEAMMATRDQAGPRPERQVQSGYFSVRGGAFVDPAAGEEMPMRARAAQRPGAGEGGGSAGPGLSTRDQVILDDLIVDGSACIGFDCVNGESFGFDTLRLKENNLRIKFQDTSSSASFPTRDWQITANDSSNGGAEKFSIDDIDGGRTPFTIEANAPSHSLYVDDGGRVGLGTSTPVVELHVVDGDSPTLRLQQDGSSGFTPQTWDVAGNETNFFVRDATNGSRLPFRIRPSAPSNSIYVDTDGDIGIGTSSPTSGAQVHIRQTDGSAQLQVEEASGTESARNLARLVNNGRVRWEMEDTSANGQIWTFFSAEDEFNISSDSTVGQEFQLSGTGDLTLTGDIITSSCPAGCGPDYVFEPDYPLMPLTEVSEFIKNNKHLPNVPSAEDRRTAQKMSLGQFQFTLLEKVEELTLYTLDQHEQIATQQEIITTLRKQNTELEARLAALEAVLGQAHP